MLHTSELSAKLRATATILMILPLARLLEDAALTEMYPDQAILARMIKVVSMALLRQAILEQLESLQPCKLTI